MTTHLDPQIAARLTETLSTRAPSSVDDSGRLSFGATVTMPARAIELDDIVERPDGSRVATTHELLTVTEVKPGTQVKWASFDWRTVQQITVGADIREGGNMLWHLKV